MKRIIIDADDLMMEELVKLASHQYKFYLDIEKDRRESGLNMVADEYHEKVVVYRKLLEAIGA